MKEGDKRSKHFISPNAFSILIPAAMAILKSADIIQRPLIAEF